MDAGHNIYPTEDETLLSVDEFRQQQEDVARLDGYLHARAEADALNRAERRRREKIARRAAKRTGDA